MLGIVHVAFVIAVDADPVHVAADQHFLLADHGDVVFRLAGHHAAAAAGAGVQINRHAPLIALVFHFGVERERILLRIGLRKLRIFLVFVERRDADQVRALPSCCASASWPAPSGRRFCELRAPCRSTACERTNPARIKSHARSDAPGARAPIAEKHRHAFIRVPWHHPCRRDNRATLILQFDGVFALDSQALGRFRAQHGHGVPGELGQRLGQFLQPAVVCKAAVPDRVVGPKNNFESLRGGGRELLRQFRA